MFKRIAVLCILVLAVGSMAYSAAEAEGAGAVEQTLIVGLSTDARTLDPHVQNDSHSEQMVAMLYNTLLKFEEDGTIVADLAKSWTVSDDKKTWTFKLNEGVMFHNGKELTSADVKGTYDRFMADDADSSRLPVTEITKMFVKVEAIDKYTVSIVTDEPYGPMMALLCNRSMAIMDPDVIAEFGETTGDFVESSIGTGPYKAVSWKKDEEVVFEKYDGYFGTPAVADTLIFRIIPEGASRVIALENGEVDFIKQFPAESLELLAANPEIQIIQKPSVGARLFRFGHNNPVIANPKVRQAIIYAIDRRAIIDGLFPGLAFDSKGPLAPVVWGHADFGVIERDLEKSKRLLAEAGYPNGLDTKIVTTPRYAKGVELAEALSAQLAEVGINAEIEVLEWSVILPMWMGVTPEVFDQPMFIMGAGTSMMDADGGLRGLYTTTETGTNERNYGFYSNAEVDKLIAAGMKETDPTARMEMYRRAQEIMYLEDPTAIWLFDRPTTVAARADLQNVEVNGIGMVAFEKITRK